MNQRIPEPIRPLLQDYLSLVNQQIPGLMTAFYVEGSIALGGFNERLSDIDCIAVLDRRATPIEIDALRHIHDAIQKRYPQWPMSGRYLRLDDLERSDGTVGPCLAWHDGVLRLDDRFELNSVEGWILKNNGVALFGPEPQDLAFAVDWDLIIEKMRENLNSYWADWTRRPRRIITLLSDWGIQWTVLGVLRQFYSFRENTITTKTKAGEYALTCIPARWHRLIREAINIREGSKKSGYRCSIVRAVQAVSFVRYIKGLPPPL